MKKLHRYLIIVAGGRGLRMGTSVPKQFLLLAGKPVIFHSIQRFIDYDPGIELVIVLPAHSIDHWKKLCHEHGFNHKHSIIEGGQERHDSVRNGLTLVRQESIVAIHDAVRPLVSIDTIDRCFRMAAQKGNAIPYIRPPESVREMTGKNTNSPLQRDNIALIQTPQVFKSEILLTAYACTYDPSFTDDASVIEAAGNKINLVEGNRENIKITTGEDIVIAESLIMNKE